jgi:acyl-CoA reductase-like NAD-dependent aldehyde dehydrogenase
MSNYDHMAHLEVLYTATRDAADEYKAAIEAAAKALDRDPKALRRYVQARARDKLHELRAELASLEQLDLDFGERREEAA